MKVKKEKVAQQRPKDPGINLELVTSVVNNLKDLYS